MLEHFGLKDIWVVVKKNRNLIAAVLALFLILFGFLTYSKLKNSNESSEEGEPLYAYSSSYYVQTNISGEKTESKDDDFYRGLPNDYIALASTDACANYVYDDDSESYYCDVNLDEDEYYRFISSEYKECPYYRSGDEYKVVRHQM